MPPSTTCSLAPETPRARLACSILTAALWWLCLQRPGWFTFGWIALTPLFWSLPGLDARQRWRHGWRTGILSYAAINWWVALSVLRGSPVIGAPPLVGAALGFLALAIEAVGHGALVGLVAWLWNPRAAVWRCAPWAFPVLIALVWMVGDVLRCSTDVGYSWGALAFSQWRDVALLQSASLIGQHGLSALCIWFAACMALWLRSGRPGYWRAPLLVFAALHGWGAWRVGRAAPPARSLRVLLVQTAVPSLRKNFEMSGETPLIQALRLTEAAARPGQFDLIVWPETTIEAVRPHFEADADETVSKGMPPRQARLVRQGPIVQVDRLCRHLGTPLLLGASTVGYAPRLRNEAVLDTPSGGESRCAKLHMVPFGERAPFVDYLPFLAGLAPEPAVTPETNSHPLDLADAGASAPPLRLGTLICYDSCFESPARALARQGAQVFFVLTNDEWFGGSEAPWEHAVMACLRAVENGRAVAQVANGGYSFVVDRYGRFMLNRTVQEASATGPSDPPTSTYGRPQAFSVVVPIS